MRKTKMAKKKQSTGEHTDVQPPSRSFAVGRFTPVASRAIHACGDRPCSQRKIKDPVLLSPRRLAVREAPLSYTKHRRIIMDAPAAVENTPADKPVSNQPVQRLRFKALRRKIAPPDFLFIDEALDRLGEQLYHDRWRNCTHLKDLPFQYRKKEGDDPRGYYYFYYVKNSKKWRFRKDRISVNKAERPEYDDARGMFRTVREKLRLALYYGEIPAVRHSLTLEEISEKTKGIWTKQLIPIFYTGYVYENRYTERYEVLIDRSKFDKWLFSQTLQTPAQVYPITDAELKALAEILTAYVRSRAYDLYREPFLKLAQHALGAAGVRASRKVAEGLWKLINPSVRMRRGHPNEEQARDQMENDTRNLVQLIRDTCLKLRDKHAHANGN